MPNRSAKLRPAVSLFSQHINPNRSLQLPEQWLPQSSKPSRTRKSLVNPTLLVSPRTSTVCPTLLGTDTQSDDLTNVAIWLTTEQNLVIIVGCVPVWRSLFTRTSNGSKKLAFGSLLSKYFPHGREMQRNSASDLEALRQPNANEGAAGAERNGNVETRNASRENGVEIPPMPRDQIEVARKDSIELPSLDLIGKPTKPTGSL